MQIITLTGNIGKDAETRTTQNGDKVTSFNVAAKNGFGRDADTTWFRISLWGKRGDALQPYLRKGGQVTVCGDLTIGEYQGKPQFDVRAHDVALQGGERRDDGGQRGGGGGGYQRQSGPAPADDLDGDDVPFASCDPAHDHPRREVMA